MTSIIGSIAIVIASISIIVIASISIIGSIAIVIASISITISSYSIVSISLYVTNYSQYYKVPPYSWTALSTNNTPLSSIHNSLLSSI